MSDEQKQSLTPSPRYRIGPLNTVQRVRAELARVYKDARNKSLSAADASRLAFILVSLGKLIEQHDFEQRLEELEARMQQHGAKWS